MKQVKTISGVTLNNIPSTAKQLLCLLEFNIVLLKGDLGAGKTTLVKALLNQMGSSDAGSSPSYALVNKYLVTDTYIYHMDLYRLQNAEEAFNLGLEEMLYSGHRCFIEWPELILDWIEPPYHIIHISLDSAGMRSIVLTSNTGSLQS